MGTKAVPIPNPSASLAYTTSLYNFFSTSLLIIITLIVIAKVPFARLITLFYLGVYSAISKTVIPFDKVELRVAVNSSLLLGEISLTF